MLQAVHFLRYPGKYYELYCRIPGTLSITTRTSQTWAHFYSTTNIMTWKIRAYTIVRVRICVCFCVWWCYVALASSKEEKPTHSTGSTHSLAWLIYIYFYFPDATVATWLPKCADFSVNIFWSCALEHKQTACISLWGGVQRSPSVPHTLTSVSWYYVAICVPVCAWNASVRWEYWVTTSRCTCIFSIHTKLSFQTSLSVVYSSGPQIEKPLDMYQKYKTNLNFTRVEVLFN